MKFGQMEIGMLIGLLLLISVVIYYAYQSNLFTPSRLPMGIQQKQQIVHDSVINLIRKASDIVLKDLETHGGYRESEIKANYVIFLNQKVPVWQGCENTYIPTISEIENRLAEGIKDYIAHHIHEMSGNGVEFDLKNLQVSAKIRRDIDRIDITVSLPTKVDGYKMTDRFYPYKVFIPSKFGEIYEFAKDFSQASAKKRFFEKFTISSIYLSADAEDGHPKLPTLGVLTHCGETIYRSPEEISQYLKETIVYTLTHIVWWGTISSDPKTTKTYAINRDILGKEYRDLKIRFHLPDRFGLKSDVPVILRSDQKVLTSPLSVFVIHDCVSVYTQTYSFTYPVIISVDDSLSRHKFYFASLVSVERDEKSMFPGTCGAISGVQEFECKDLECETEMKITDSKGNPLEGVVGTFGGCWIGESGKDGKIHGKIKCGKHQLIIYKEGYDMINITRDSSLLKGSYILYKTPQVKVHFRIVEEREIDDDKAVCVTYPPNNQYIYVEVSGKNKYGISNINSESINENCMEEEVCKKCETGESIEDCEKCFRTCIGGYKESVEVGYIPRDTYIFTAKLLTSDLKEAGYFRTNYLWNENLKDVYINIPKTNKPRYQLKDSQKTRLEEILSECGIQPISLTEPPSSKTIWV